MFINLSGVLGVGTSTEKLTKLALKDKKDQSES